MEAKPSLSQDGLRTRARTWRSIKANLLIVAATSLLSWLSAWIEKPICLALDAIDVPQPFFAVLSDVCLAVLFFVLSKIPLSLARAFATPKSMGACGSSLALCVLVLNAVPARTDSLWLVIVLAFLSAVLYGILWITCLAQYCRLAYVEMLPVCLASMASSAVLCSVTSLVSAYYAHIVLACCTPLVACVALWCHGKQVRDDCDDEVRTAEVPGGGFSAKSIWLMFLFAAVYSYMLYYLPLAQVSVVPYGGVLACAAALLVCFKKSPVNFNEWTLCNLAVPFVLCALILEFAEPVPWNFVSAFFAGTGNMLFNVYVLVALANTAFRRGTSPYALFGFAEAVRAVSRAAGILMGYAVTSMPEQVGSGVFIVFAVCVAFSSTLLVSGNKGDAMFGGRSSLFGADCERDPAARLIARCGYLARLHGLTQREEETLRLIMQDMTPGDIAERLVLSINTVRTHINALYRKTDTHSRQQLQEYVLGEGETSNDG